MRIDLHSRPMDWDLTTIGKCCEILDYKRIPINSKERLNRQGSIPYYGANGQQGWINDYIFDEDLILIAEDGGNFDEYTNKPIAYKIKGRTWVNNHAHVLRARETTTNSWIFYNLVHRDIRQYIKGATRSKLNQSELHLIELALPRIHEQNRIISVLTTMDEQLQHTQQLIAKLELQRAGLLHKLLTCGINEHGQLRNFMINPEQFQDTVLGKVPKDWDVKKLKDFYTIPAKNGLYKPPNYYGRGTLMIHMSQMFRGSTVDLSDASRVDVSISEYERFNLLPGDLVFARRSLSFEGAGRCSIIPILFEPTTFESSIIRVRLSKNLIQPAFVNQFLNSNIGFRLRTPLIRQVAASGVSAQDIASMPIPYPSLEEQYRILKTLDITDSNIKVEKEHYDKLKLYKNGLMQDLLTGKVRVVEK